MKFVSFLVKLVKGFFGVKSEGESTESVKKEECVVLINDVCSRPLTVKCQEEKTLDLVEPTTTVLEEKEVLETKVEEPIKLKKTAADIKSNVSKKEEPEVQTESPKKKSKRNYNRKKKD